MAAPASKPGAVHYWLIGVSMLALILMVTTFLFYKDYKEQALLATTAKNNESAANLSIGRLQEDIESIKQNTGWNQAEVSALVENLKKDVKNYAGDDKLTVTAALQQLHTRLEAALAENGQLKENLKGEVAQFQSMKDGNNKKVEEFKASKAKSEQDLAKLVTERDEQLRQKDEEIKKWQQAYRQEQIEKEQINDEKIRREKELGDRIAKLNGVVDFQRQRLEEIENLTFDVPDGLVTNVDNTSGTIWLNLGRKDGLRPQVTFSVYGKTNKGIARGPEDVKAKIEVVEVRDTSAIARIIQEERDRPVGIGDVVFSPAWNAGLIEYFSIVGNADLNLDGVMDEKDRKILKDRVALAGAKIDVEVTSEGTREPADSKISVQTKWLIVGDVGDPSTAVGDDAKMQRILAVQKQHETLVQEAREHGTRIVSMKDFLTYLGWKPESRLYIPGSEAPFTLRAGAHSTGVNEFIGDRSSTTPVSKAIMKGVKK